MLARWVSRVETQASCESSGEKHALIVQRRIVRELFQARAIGVNSIEIGFSEATSLGCENNPLAVIGKVRMIVKPPDLSEHLAFAGAVGIGNVELGLRRTDAVHQHHFFGQCGQTKT